MKALTLVAVVLALTVMPFALAEDEPAPAPEAPAAPELKGKPAVVAALKKALAEAEKESWETMIKAAQKAIDEAQKIQQGDLKTVFPAAPAGFKAGEIESQRMAMGGEGGSHAVIHLIRKYTRESDGAVVTMTVSNWAMYRAGHTQWLKLKESMPDMLEQMGVSVSEKDGFDIVKIMQPEGRQASLIGLGEKLILALECNKKDMAPIDAIFGQVDLKNILGRK